MSKVDLYVQPKGSLLVPVDEHGENLIRSMKRQEYACALKRERGFNRAKKLHVLIGIVSVALNEMGASYASREYVKARFKIAAGYADVIPMSKVHQEAYGHRYAIMARSTSESSMSDEDFNNFWNEVVQFTLTDLAPHFSPRYSRQVEDLLIRETMPV
ncbi:MAG: hypothetical protein AAGE80_05585 [Pseudomonadota bacterium]